MHLNKSLGRKREIHRKAKEIKVSQGQALKWTSLSGVFTAYMPATDKTPFLVRLYQREPLDYLQRASVSRIIGLKITGC